MNIFKRAWKDMAGTEARKIFVSNLVIIGLQILAVVFLLVIGAPIWTVFPSMILFSMSIALGGISMYYIGQRKAYEEEARSYE